MSARKAAVGGAPGPCEDRLDDVFAWLAECRYETDTNLFHESDYWQHPRTFEQLRCGDCEDFAIAKYFAVFIC